MNLGNPNEFTLLELAEVVIEVDRVALGDRLRGAAGRRPPGAPARHHPRQAAPRLGAGGRARATACAARSSRRASSGSSAPRTDRAAPRGYGARCRATPAHRPPDGDLPPTRAAPATPCYRFARGPGRARPPRRGLHGPGGGRAAGPRRGDRPPDRPGVRDRQRAADPEHRPDRGLRRRPPPLSVHLRLRADAARPAEPRRRGARRCSSTTRTGWSARARAGRCSTAYEHTVAPALIRAADRVCVLSPDHADSVPYLRATGRARRRRS